ncbi:hypothetical protein OESDEN_19577 [Oesophagostomum dentatum]|uniref:Uncharacterized protein n=1 Tax=Oesophagostomum dentatum TaxID=61180 RepID=A0A0B1S734_OESDE|nr:hypothetical protein OESDEN_19577 [Oesophagostomum dentatum]
MPAHSPVELAMPSNDSSASSSQLSEEKPFRQTSTPSGEDVHDDSRDSAIDDHPSFHEISAADLLGHDEDVKDMHKEAERSFEKPKKTRTSGKIPEPTTSYGKNGEASTSSEKIEEASSAEDEDASK